MSVSRFLAQLLRDGARRRPVRKSLRFRPGLESLECRLAPANVTTSLVGGNLTITDNAPTSSLTISQPAANQITITADPGTTINGRAGQVTIIGVTGNLSVNLGTGTDTLTFDLSAHNIDVGNVSITGSTGNKTVLTNTAGTTHYLNVHGNFKEIFGNGSEFTRLNQFCVNGNMTIDHATGGSFVFLGVDAANLGRKFNTVGGDLHVDNVTATGAAASGFDVNALEETNVGGDLVSNMGFADQSGGSSNGIGGWTSVGSQSTQSVTVGGDVTLTAKSGFLSFGDFANDSLEVQNARVAGDVTLDLGSGTGNTALFGGGTAANSTTAQSVTITGQGAHDAVTVGASQVGGDLSVSLTGKGGNAIAVDSVFVTGDTSLTAEGGANSIAIDNQAPGSTFGGRTDITMTGKNNVLEINSKHRVPQTATTTFNDKVSAQLGAGNDTLILAEIGKVDFEAAAKFNGGPGKKNTALVNGGNLVAGAPTLVNLG
jgi:hypothetical protein